MPDVFALYEPGEEIGQYRIATRLSRSVEYPCRIYLAEHGVLKRQAEIAILTEDDPALVREWYRNARLMGQLSHPNIPALYDAGVHHGRLYLAVAYVGGVSFYQLVTMKAQLSLSVILKVMAAAARALLHAHEKGVIHKNIRLRNIMISPDGEAFLGGFWGAPEGAADAVPGAEDFRVRRFYASPEQLLRERASVATNLWDFGAMMFHLLTGRPPYYNKDFARARQSDAPAQPVDFSRLEGKAPEFVVGIVERCLSDDAAGRYQSAGEIVRDIEAALDYLETTGSQTLELATPRKGQALLLHVEYQEAERLGAYREYEIGEHISRGRYGDVYRARELLSGEDVALKLLRHERVADLDAVARFRREAALLARLSHPTIVRVHNWGRWGPSFFIAMDLLAGPTVAELLAESGRMSAADAARLALEVTAGLAAVHQAGAIHRDLKPANICRVGDRYVVFDFGMAHMPEADKLTLSGVIPGSPAYMSPEQASGEPLTSSSDIYALGVTLYEVLAGKLPHRADSTPELLRRITRDAPAPLQKLRPDLPVALGGIVARMMAKKPGGRPTAREVHDLLARGAVQC